MSGKYSPGEVLPGKVDGVQPYGAFIELPDGRVGMIHVSKMAQGYVRSAADYFSRGDKVEVEVLSDQGNRIRLAAVGEPQRDFEKMLETALQQHDERLAEQSRNRTHRAGGRP